MMDDDLDTELNHLLKLNEGPRLLRMMRKVSTCITIDTHSIFIGDTNKNITTVHRIVAGICLVNHNKTKKAHLRSNWALAPYVIKQEPEDWFVISDLIENVLVKTSPPIKSVSKWQADILASPLIEKLEDARILKQIVSNRFLKLNIPTEDFGFKECSHSLKMLGVIHD